MFIDLTKEGTAQEINVAPEEAPKKTEYRGNYEYDHSRTELCSKCGNSINPKNAFCTHCGAPIGESSNQAHSNTTSNGNPNNVNYSYNQANRTTGDSFTTSNEGIKEIADSVVTGVGAIVSDANSFLRKSAKNKWISLLLCIFTVFGHKIYEGKIGWAIVYLFTGGLFGIGLIIDVIRILSLPETYYVDNN